MRHTAILAESLCIYTYVYRCTSMYACVYVYYVHTHICICTHRRMSFYKYTYITCYEHVCYSGLSRSKQLCPTVPPLQSLYTLPSKKPQLWGLRNRNSVGFTVRGLLVSCDLQKASVQAQYHSGIQAQETHMVCFVGIQFHGDTLVGASGICSSTITRVSWLAERLRHHKQYDSTTQFPWSTSATSRHEECILQPMRLAFGLVRSRLHGPMTQRLHVALG